MTSSPKLDRLAREAQRELRPQLDGLEPTAARMARVRKLALEAGKFIELGWGGVNLPAVDASELLLTVASSEVAAIGWLANRLVMPVDQSPIGCWILQLKAEHDSKGRARYPTLSSKEFGASGELAHRFVVRRLIGSLETTEHLDHLCRSHACCNPTHLEIVTHTSNMRRGAAARKAVIGQNRLPTY